MAHSVRLGFVDWCKSAGNSIAKMFVKALRYREVHAQPGGDFADRFVPCINDGRAKRQIDDAIHVPKLGKQIDIENWHVCVSYFPPLGVNGEGSTAFQHHLRFISHVENLPQLPGLAGDKLNPATRGVQP